MSPFHEIVMSLRATAAGLLSLWIFKGTVARDFRPLLFLRIETNRRCVGVHTISSFEFTFTLTDVLKTNRNQQCHTDRWGTNVSTFKNQQCLRHRWFIFFSIRYPRTWRWIEKKLLYDSGLRRGSIHDKKNERPQS